MKSFGPNKMHRVVAKSGEWPDFAAYKTANLETFEQEALLRDIKITKIEWNCVDTITTMRFGFSDGSASP